MTSTNRAFIDAYRSRRVVQPAASTARPFAEPPILVVEEAEDSTEPVATANARCEPVKGPSSRRPLSTFRDQVAAPGRGTSTIRAASAESLVWPERCRQLLAAAADEYDTVLRSATSGPLVGIIGASPEVGCSTTAICLALRSASLPCPTALVDANLAAPGLAAMLGAKVDRPWNQVLKGDELLTAVVRASSEGIDLLLAGPAALDELTPTAKFRASLAAGWLRREYERTIFDLGSVATPGGDRLAADLAAAMRLDQLLVVTGRRTTNDELACTLRRLNSRQLQVTGIIAAA